MVKSSVSLKNRSSKEKVFSESKAKFYAFPTEVVSKDLPVFYNPAMELNRDITIAVLDSLPDDDLHACDLLAGTGVRTLRFLLELKKNKLGSIVANDSNPKFQSLMKKNLKLNKLSASRITLSENDANLALLGSTGFDYIDLDPFGTPNPFIDSACKRLSREGILAVTATDTSALCGSFPDACKRKYWATPRHDFLMHEAGLRILARKVQLVAAQFEKALIPIYSYSHEHHMRIFFRAKKQKTAVDEIIDQHRSWDGFGPLWTGQLWDKDLAKKVSVKCQNLSQPAQSMSALIKEEAAIPVLGFYDIHEVGRMLKLGDLPKIEPTIESIREKSFLASRTHFCGSGIRTDMPFDKFKMLVNG